MTQGDANEFFGKLNGKGKWADLGCGSGTFTRALASRLAKGSLIYAIDTDRLALSKIDDDVDGVNVETIDGDFNELTVIPKNLDGILMANSLHYVPDALGFVKAVGALQEKRLRWLLVEYDREDANPWVPYPLSVEKAKAVFMAAGYTTFNKLYEKKSAFGEAMLYAMEVSK